MSGHSKGLMQLWEYWNAYEPQYILPELVHQRLRAVDEETFVASEHRVLASTGVGHYLDCRYASEN